MNWYEYRRFLLCQLAARKDTQNSDFLDTVFNSDILRMDDSFSALLDPASVESRSINSAGLGEMYKQHLIRTSVDAAKAIVGSAYIEGTSRTTTFYGAGARAHFRASLYRRLPLVMAVSGAYRQYRFALTAFDDITSGQFPGTDESFFV